MERPDRGPEWVQKQEKSSETAENKDHAEAVAFVEKHRDFLEHYARGRVKIEPAPAGLSTFAFDLEKDTIYANSMFYRERGFSDEKTLFAMCHEIEHFLEKRAMLGEEGGTRKFERYLKRIKESKAFSLMDNCNADIRENRSVVSRTNVGMGELETKIYKEDLFIETDFTAAPRHIQFSQALLREARVPDERCVIAPEVRTALDEVSKVKGLMEVMTNPETPMSLRLKLQDKYLWPKVQALLEQDLEDKKKEQKEQKEKQKGGEGGEPSEESKQDGGEGEGESDPNKIFAADYTEAEKKFAEAVPVEEIEKALKEWQEAQAGKDSADQADADYAEKIGVSKEELQNYRQVVQSLEKIVNPETDVGVIEELRSIFARIISKRLKVAPAPKYPVEEGDELVDPAQLVADVKAGNLQPKVWEDTELKEKRGDNYGEVEISLVCDRSGSMAEGQKAEEQRRSAVLIMEVLKEFAELCEEEKTKVDKPLEIRSEIYSFARSPEDKTPLKAMSAELGEAERINVLKKLYDLTGSTTDFNCLEAIDGNLDQNIKNKIKIGELKKIVIVLTDGVSDSPQKVQAALKKLRDSGVVVIGVGITKAGEPVLTTYAPEAKVVEETNKLPLAIGDLLKEHLKDL